MIDITLLQKIFNNHLIYDRYNHYLIISNIHKQSVYKKCIYILTDSAYQEEYLYDTNIIRKNCILNKTKQKIFIHENLIITILRNRLINKLND